MRLQRFIGKEKRSTYMYMLSFVRYYTSNASTPNIMFHISIVHQIMHTEVVDSRLGVSCQILNWCLRLRYFHLSRQQNINLGHREEYIQQSTMLVK